MTVNVHVAPDRDPEVERAVEAAGGRVAPLDDADALVWLDWSRFPDRVPSGVRWVQLPSAGVERWLERIDPGRVWTSAAGAFAHPVAEHALALMLAGARRLA